MSCPDSTKSGKPCPNGLRRAGPDPDGVHRCAGHSQHPDAIATRRKQASVGRAAGLATSKAQVSAPRASATDDDGVPLVDFSTSEGVQRYLEDVARGGFRGTIASESLKAMSAIAGRALSRLQGGPGGSGAGRGDKIIIPTVVQSMDDVRALKAVNDAAEADDDTVTANGVH